MANETLRHDQASELYAWLSREAVARNARARRLRLVARSGMAIALLALALGAGLATNWGRESTRYPTLHPTKSTASAEAIRRAGSKMFGDFPSGLVWEPRLKWFGDDYATSVSLAEARARATFPVEAPSSVLPDSSIKRVWLRETGPFPEVVAIEYEHLEIVETPMDSAYNGPRSYRGMAGEQADRCIRGNSSRRNGVRRTASHR